MWSGGFHHRSRASRWQRKSTLALEGQFKSWVSMWPWPGRFPSLNLSSDVYITFVSIWCSDIFFIGWCPHHMDAIPLLGKFYYWKVLEIGSGDPGWGLTFALWTWVIDPLPFFENELYCSIKWKWYIQYWLCNLPLLARVMQKSILVKRIGYEIKISGLEFPLSTYLAISPWESYLMSPSLSFLI